jgi:AcrR family transcriptional regulator
MDVVPRWPEDSRSRLVDAAMSLFGEHGYSGTTVDEIAARAGVTARTFFRHFADKEEVLFADDDTLLPGLLQSITAAPGPIAADALMLHALTTLAAVMQPQRPALVARQRIIDTDVSLTGRELAKQARWQQGVTATLIERGFDPDEAEILSAIGFAIFSRALHAWLADDDANGPDLATRVRDALPRARTVLDAVSAR